MNSLHFSNSEYLYTLWVLLPGVALLWYANFYLRRQMRKYNGEEQLVNRYSHRMRLVAELPVLLAWAAIVALLVVAAAGPIRPDAPEKVQTGSLQVVLLIDGSKSSRAEDYRTVMSGPNGTDGASVIGPHGSRLDMAKYVIQTRIMPAIIDNQIGIVTYAGNGYPQAPLTTDFEALRFVMDNWMTVLQPIAPGGGSHMVDGLKVALATFKNRADPKKQKVLVLFSDGGFDDQLADLDQLLPEVVKQQIRVVIVGLGGSTPMEIPEYVQDGDGQYQFKGWAKQGGKVVATAFDSTVLQHIVDTTGGQLIHLEKAADLNINWPTALAGDKVQKHETPVFQYPLAGAAILIGILSLSGLFRRKDLV